MESPPSPVANSPSNLNLVRPVVHLLGRHSAPGSRRGSGGGLCGNESFTGEHFNILFIKNCIKMLLEEML